MTTLSIPFPVVDNVTEQDQLIQVIEQFIIGMTESLCRLENEPGTHGQKEEFRKQKQRILEQLDLLDRLLASHRTFKLPAAAASIMTEFRRTDQPEQPTGHV